MASSLSTAHLVSASASSAVVKTSANLPHYTDSTLSKVSFRLSPKPKLRFSTKGPVRNSSTLVRAQLNEVAVDGSSSASAASPIKSEIPSEEEKDASYQRSLQLQLWPQRNQYLSLCYKFKPCEAVDSRDIVELHLKQLDCELVIRKKEALPQPVSPAPVVMMHPPSPSPQPLMAPAPPAASLSASSPASSAQSQSSSPPAAKSQKSSLPQLKCPMAGTFYRSPGPGEPPFVKELNEDVKCESAFPDSKFLSKDGQPKELFLSSDANAVVEHTRRVLMIEDNEVVHLKTVFVVRKA